MAHSAADVNTPWVNDGAGAAKGMTPMEHVVWSQNVINPLSQTVPEVDDDLIDTVNFVCEETPSTVDDVREKALRWLTKVAADLRGEQEEWVNCQPFCMRRLVKPLHAPLVWFCCQYMVWPDEDVCGDLAGFPFVGVLPKIHYSAKPLDKPMKAASEKDLAEVFVEQNQEVLRALKELPYADDIAGDVQKDVAIGAMTEPEVLSSKHVQNFLLTRRIPVREEKAAGWRTRVADHATESAVNIATSLRDRMRHDTVDVMVWFMLVLMNIGGGIKSWKRDVKRAFKRVPIAVRHAKFAGAAWMCDNVAWFSQHLGMPFGTTSAGHGWHRLANVVIAVARRIVRVVVGRYVDDMFGCDRETTRRTGGWCIDVLFQLFGIPLDPEKSHEYGAVVELLGVLISPWTDQQLVSVQVTVEKAHKWIHSLEECLERGSCDAGMSGKFAGRLSFACCVAADRVGRNFIGPFYAQQHAPMAEDVISVRWKRCAKFWIKYLTERPAAVRYLSSHRRPSCTMWTDASGVTRGLAAVLRVGGRFFYTSQRTPDVVWNQLLPRRDHQIGIQETLAIVLGLSTFADLLRGALLVCFCDNEGVKAAMSRGASVCPESSAMVGDMWMLVARERIGLFVARVESKANIADAPSRDDASVMQAMGAQFVDPVLPSWLNDIWSRA